MIPKKYEAGAFLPPVVVPHAACVREVTLVVFAAAPTNFIAALTFSSPVRHFGFFLCCVGFCCFFFFVVGFGGVFGVFGFWLVLCFLFWFWVFVCLERGYRLFDDIAYCLLVFCDVGALGRCRPRVTGSELKLSSICSQYFSIPPS